MHSDKSILQRLAEARVSDDLTHKTRLCDVDYCQGAGLAGMRHRVGSALMDLDLTLNKSAVGPALIEVARVVRALSREKNWVVTPRAARNLAGEALRQYLAPACEQCCGRGVLGVDRSDPQAGKPRPCPACRASGKRPIHGDTKTVRRIAEVLAIMERARREFGGAVRRKMRVAADVE